MGALVLNAQTSVPTRGRCRKVALDTTCSGHHVVDGCPPGGSEYVSLYPRLVARHGGAVPRDQARGAEGVHAVGRPGWYVIQVRTGRERAAREAILRAARSADAESDRDRPLVEECFSPRYATRHKVHGQWVDDELDLLPGYVVAVTDDPWSLSRLLSQVSGFAMLLKAGETFAPLSGSDREWLEGWTKRGDRTVPMSFAYKSGDAIVVTEGPLAGREATITRVNRRRCLAHVELRVGPKVIHTTVGLAVLPDGSRQENE